MSITQDFECGDKVLVLRGEHQGTKGIVTAVGEGVVDISFGSGSATVPFDAVQNFSAAARKAWRTRPLRAAGRPPTPAEKRKRMVSIRIEESVWRGLEDAAQAGLIQSREAIVNEWLRIKLHELRMSSVDADRT
jgi:hypothetical protein